jgi:hypothetical protein
MVKIKSSIKRNVLIVRIEWGNGEFAAQVKTDEFLLTSQGNSVPDVLAKLQHLVADYMNHEGKNIPRWRGLHATELQFQCEYNLAAFFEYYSELKISAIAVRAGINSNLLQQYVSGNKRASENQACKIQKAIHDLADDLRKVTLAY